MVKIHKLILPVFIIIPMIFLTIICTQCGVNQSTSDSFIEAYSEDSPRIDKVTKSNISNYTKIFLSDLKKEIAKSNAEKFIPSESFLAKYEIKERDRTYFIGGMIRISDVLNESELNDLGVIIGTKLNGMWTVQIPILIVEEICKLEGVDYLQIDEPVNQR
jgi:hypothetical protein